MASTSSFMASSSLHQTRFDVFLSFRGEDTRHTFTDHLYTALKQAAIHTFRDDDEIRRGQDLAPELVKAIESSRASIIVLSENYAKSRWCLEELSLILEQRRKGNHFVLPVFYHVDPSDVRNQRQSFAIEGSKWTEDNVKQWKSALREVANFSGTVASGSEAEFIANIVDTVYYELDLKLISTPAHLTGMETRAEEITSWLKNENSDTNVLAICGMGGIGKTTLAQYIYNSNKHNFESSCFLEDVAKHFKQTYGLLELQKLLLTNIIGGKNILISCVSEGTTKIKEALHMKKVLIVLDDIDEHDELCALLGTSVLDTKSKIILTTRLLDIHSWFESISWRCHLHELKLLNDDESLEVFSCHAFGSKHPREGFSDLAIELAQYCGGNPLALKVLGSSLFVSAEDPRERNIIIEIWRSRLNSLSSMNGDLDSKIQCVLQKSFDSLPLVSYKELFLDIVVLFVGEDKDYVVNILEHDYHAKVGIMTLINRCLITVSPNKKLVMHQLLQDMGRSIVREESKDPAKRTRVWCSDEVYQLLTTEEGSKTIVGLTLDTRTLKKGTKFFQASVIKTNSLSKMHKLKLLQLKYVKLKGNYKNFPELRWLCWYECHLKAIPSGLLSSFLVALDMTRGNLEVFEAPTVLNSLKILNLEGCIKLVSICKFYRLPNLETLILCDCWNLTHVCETIQGLKNLSLLNLGGCNLWKESWNKKLTNQYEKLKALCIGGGVSEQPLFSLPRSLKFLFLECSNLKNQSDLRVSFNGPLYGLSFCANLFDFMPNNIDLKMLRVLNLDYCYNLKSIMCLPSTLEELYTYECKSLEKVTFQSTRFRLKKFDYIGCLSLCEVQGLFKMVALKKFDEADLGRMKWVKSYQDNKVNLVINEIYESKIQHIQILYEYGIRSTYLQGVKDQSMLTHEYTSSSDYLSFCVPLHPKKHKIRGLNVSCLYRLSRSKDKKVCYLFIGLRNITKGVTWIYNPLVYCKPGVNEDAMWLSYWPFGNILDVGDEVYVRIVVEKGMEVSGCGANLEYMDVDGGCGSGEVKQEAHHETNTMKMEEVIGGDLSEFEVSKGVYYLCRRDLFKKSIAKVIKGWVGDSIAHTELQGWRKSYQYQFGEMNLSCMHWSRVLDLHRDTLYKFMWLRYSNEESDIRNIKKAVFRLGGVDFVCSTRNFLHTNSNNLYVLGHVDSMTVEACLREFEKTVWIKDVNYKVNRLLKIYFKEIRGKIPKELHSLIVKFVTRVCIRSSEEGNPQYISF